MTLDEEMNKYLNPLLSKLMEDSFNNLKWLHEENHLHKQDLPELEFFVEFIIDAREFYQNQPDKIKDLDIIDTVIKHIIKSKNNG